jgi:succinate dehydrogenase flavin-adding protein (antitoxin of CptAB toxin-antitoxin module)
MPEISGSIIDYIIHNQNSPFINGFWKLSDALLDNFENKGRILIAENTSSISVDIDGLILNFVSTDFDKDIKRIKEEIIPFFKQIFKEFDIENINRIGMVFEFENKDQNAIEKMVSTLTNSRFSKADRFDLVFSQKDQDMRSLVNQKIFDYANNIIRIRKLKDNIVATFDFQFYYDPEVNSIEDIEFDEFIKIAIEHLDKDFWLWYQKNEK